MASPFNPAAIPVGSSAAGSSFSPGRIPGTGTVANDNTAAYVTACNLFTPLLLWKGDDASGHMADSSGSGNPSTAESGTLGYAIPCVTPLGTGNFIQGGAITRAQVTAVVDNVTLIFWVLPLGKGAGSQSMCGNNNGGSNGYEIITAAGTGGVKFVLVCQGVGSQATSANTCLFNAWNMIAVVRAAGTWKYYFNGAVDTANAGVAAPIAPSGGTSNVNRDASGSTLWRLYSVHASALSAANIATLYATLTA